VTIPDRENPPEPPGQRLNTLDNAARQAQILLAVAAGGRTKANHVDDGNDDRDPVRSWQGRPWLLASRGDPENAPRISMRRI
jgi:hypothetical protein